MTAADPTSEAVILHGLRQVLSGVPVVSEEAGSERPQPQPGERFLLVDPLDGTREFLGGLPEYTVNIALVSEGRPVAGVVAAPALGDPDQRASVRSTSGQRRSAASMARSGSLANVSRAASL